MYDFVPKLDLSLAVGKLLQPSLEASELALRWRESSDDEWLVLPLVVAELVGAITDAGLEDVREAVLERCVVDDILDPACFVKRQVREEDCFSAKPRMELVREECPRDEPASVVARRSRCLLEVKDLDDRERLGDEELAPTADEELTVVVSTEVDVADIGEDPPIPDLEDLRVAVRDLVPHPEPQIHDGVDLRACVSRGQKETEDCQKTLHERLLF